MHKVVLVMFLLGDGTPTFGSNPERVPRGNGANADTECCGLGRSIGSEAVSAIFRVSQRPDRGSSSDHAASVGSHDDRGRAKGYPTFSVAGIRAEDRNAAARRNALLHDSFDGLSHPWMPKFSGMTQRCGEITWPNEKSRGRGIQGQYLWEGFDSLERLDLRP